MGAAILLSSFPTCKLIDRMAQFFWRVANRMCFSCCSLHGALMSWLPILCAWNSLEKTVRFVHVKVHTKVRTTTADIDNGRPYVCARTALPTVSHELKPTCCVARLWRIRKNCFKEFIATIYTLCIVRTHVHPYWDQTECVFAYFIWFSHYPVGLPTRSSY